MALNSRIILVKNIKLDKEYNNVLNYSEEDMVNLCVSENHLVNQATNYSFIKHNKIIRVNFSYAECLKANYIAYQNPNYSNKWFFGWIDAIEYKSDNCCELSITIDVWSTWFSYWEKKPCYVIREHVNDDTVGLHTIEESIELGEYVNSSAPTQHSYSGKYICVCVSEDLFNESELPPTFTYNGVAGGCIYILLDSTLALSYFINKYKAKPSAIISVFVIPREFVPSPNWIAIESTQGHYAYVPDSNNSYNLTGVVVPKNNHLADNFVPKNKKLLCFPYRYLLASNNAGGDVVYRYEDFENPSGMGFNVIGAIGVGCDIKYIPTQYKKYSFDSDVRNYEESFNNAKFPIGNWVNDATGTWFAQNKYNLATQGISTGLETLGGIGLLLTPSARFAGASMLAGAVTSVADSIGQITKAKLIPDQASGNVGSSDVMYGVGKIGATFYHMSIKKEFAEYIDSYFTKFGYKVNILKNPNITGRRYWNYVQIGGGEHIGYSNNSNVSVPISDMDTINSACQKGVTIWHNHDNIGNYNLDNAIVTQ